MRPAVALSDCSSGAPGPFLCPALTARALHGAKHDGNGIRIAFSTVQVAGAMMRLPPWRARNWS
jgi:hypothetical protein